MKRLLVLLVLGGCLAGASPAAAVEYGAPQLISHFRPDEQPNGSVSQLDITPDGRYVVYFTDAPNIPRDPETIPADPTVTTAGGVFRYDRQTGSTDQVAYGYAEGGTGPSISADGRLVLFSTSRLLPTDESGGRRVYLRDMARPLDDRGAYRDVSVRANGQPFGEFDGVSAATATSLSDDGTRLLLNDNGAFVWRDLRTDTTRVVTAAYDPLSDTMTDRPVYGNSVAALSADGTTVVWRTEDAAQFTPSRPGEQNEVAVIWRRVADGLRARARRAVSSTDLDDPACTPQTPVTRAPDAPTPCDNVELDEGGGSNSFSISRDGYTVLFSSGGHLRGSGLPPIEDAYVTTMFPGDTRKGATTPLTRVIPAGGGSGDPAVNAPVEVSLSPDGRYAALVTSRITFALSPPAFLGNPSPIVGAKEVYVIDRSAGTLQLLTRAYDGGKQLIEIAGQNNPTNGSTEVALADGASTMAFASNGINLVPGDVNNRGDAFVVTRLPTNSVSGVTGPQLEAVPPVPGPFVGDGDLSPAGLAEVPPPPTPQPVASPVLRVSTSRQDQALRVRVRVPTRGRVLAVASRGKATVSRAQASAKRAGIVTLRLRHRKGRAMRVRLKVEFRPSAEGARTLRASMIRTLPGDGR